jgi:hypothetical protein
VQFVVGDRWRRGERGDRPHAAQAQRKRVSNRFIFFHLCFSYIANMAIYQAPIQ